MVFSVPDLLGVGGAIFCVSGLLGTVLLVFVESDLLEVAIVAFCVSNLLGTVLLVFVESDLLGAAVAVDDRRLLLRLDGIGTADFRGGDAGRCTFGVTTGIKL